MRRQLQVANNAGLCMENRQRNLADAWTHCVIHAAHRREPGMASGDGQMFLAPASNDQASGRV